MNREAMGWWVTGLVDGEGCFFASLRHRSGNQAGYSTDKRKRYDFMDFSARFMVLMRADDLAALQKLEEYFGVGYTTVRKNGRYITGKSGSRPEIYAEYRCSRTSDLCDVIIPHFERYPLQTRKQRDFDLWRLIVRFYRDHVFGRRALTRKDPESVQLLSNAVQKLREGRKFDETGLVEGVN